MISLFSLHSVFVRLGVVRKDIVNSESVSPRMFSTSIEPCYV